MNIPELAVIVLVFHHAASTCPNETNLLYYSCPQKTFQFGQRCYKAAFSKLPFLQASKFCNTLGGSLATINNSTVNQFLYEMVRRDYARKGNIMFWIGLNDRDNEGTFRWSDCGHKQLTKGDYRKWLAGEPDNGNVLLDAKGSHDCVTWYWSSRPAWSDEDCDRANNFICQIQLSEQVTSKELRVSEDGESQILSTQNIIIVSISSTFLVIFIMMLIYWKWKRDREKDRVKVLRQTGIYPGAGKTALRTNAFEIPVANS